MCFTHIIRGQSSDSQQTTMLKLRVYRSFHHFPIIIDIVKTYVAYNEKQFCHIYRWFTKLINQKKIILHGKPYIILYLMRQFNNIIQDYIQDLTKVGQCLPSILQRGQIWQNDGDLQLLYIYFSGYFCGRFVPPAFQINGDPCNHQLNPPIKSPVAPFTNMV